MGIAIVCIMLCHNTVTVPGWLVLPRRVLTAMFQCGVDMFMLLSGLGLCYSFHKNPKKSTFWKKRYGKIFPPYVISVFVYGFVYVGYMRRATLKHYLWTYSLISFYTDAVLSIWFIAAIILLYAVFPLLYTAMQRHYKGFSFMCIAVAAGCLGLSFIDCHKTLRIINEIFISRVPAFLLGMIIAKAILDEKKPSVTSCAVWLTWLLSAVLIIWVLLATPRNFWTITRLLFLPFSLSGMLILTMGMDKCNKNGCLYRSLSSLGGVTLELYLIHERVLMTINAYLYLFDASPVLLSVAANIFAILVSLVGAWVLKKVVLVLTFPWKRMFHAAK